MTEHTSDSDDEITDRDGRNALKPELDDVSNESRARAIQSLLVEKGLLSTDAVDEIIATYEREIGPLNGAHVVARAWTDPAYRERLLDDTTTAVSELGIDVELHNVELEAVENTDVVHNLVVCTLCSCYPWAVLGLPPTWYKSEAYRARAAREPRTLLAEDFGLSIDDGVDIRVWDSSSELRYFVLPQRPPATEGYSEAELVELVSRDAMIGVDRLDSPPVADGGVRSKHSLADAFGVPLDGNPTFHAPWQARAFAIAVALESDQHSWGRFQAALGDALDTGAGSSPDPEEWYYKRWLSALEQLLFSSEILTQQAFADRATAFEAGDRTAEEWIEGHHGHGHD